jgi:hypothetical protein
MIPALACRVSSPSHEMLLQHAAHRQDVQEDITRTLIGGAQILRRVHRAYRSGTLKPAHISVTIALRDDMGMMLAHFEDSPAFGTVSAKTIETMRRYEAMAASMIEAVCFPHGHGNSAPVRYKKRAIGAGI